MSGRSHLLVALSLLALATACSNAGSSGDDDDDDVTGVDAAPAEPDAAPPVPDGAPDVPDAEPAGPIQQARDAADGAVDIVIPSALVTYLKPAVGNDVAGFFIQREATGPALFVAVDPATLAPVPAVGDDVTLRVLAMGTAAQLRQATSITDFAVTSSDNDTAALRQVLTDTANPSSLIDSLESELVTLSGTIAADFGFAGPDHQSAQIDVSATPDANFKLRVPTTLRDDLDLANGCEVTLIAGPMWRFNAQAQPSAYTTADLAVDGGCPAPEVASAIAIDATTVRVTFTRHLESSSVLSDGSQFTITGGAGLAVTAASVDGRTVTLTTDAQVGDQPYTVTVATTVTDAVGGVLSGTANTADFTGYVVLADVLISEVNANIASGCDLVELHVVSGGSMSGFELQERNGVTLVTFAGLTVATDDVIVVHLNGSNATCNPDPASGNEVSATNEYPAATYGKNYDGAWDWYSTDTGLFATTNVLTLYDNEGTILDAVLLTDDPASASAASDTETQAAVVADAGEWEMIDGGTPMGGFVDADFNAHAVADLNATGTTASGQSIQRKGTADTNTLDDWIQAYSTWGSSEAPPPPPTGPIQEAREAADGATDVSIPSAFVTYKKPAVGSDAPGFFIQKDALGPALFVAVDPSTLTPEPVVGDEVALRVTEMGTTAQLRQATVIADYSVLSAGNDLAALRQDLTGTVGASSRLELYESELFTMTGTLASDFSAAGAGHEAAQLDISTTPDSNFELRLPTGLSDALELSAGCNVTLLSAPMWRTGATAQPSAYVAGDLVVNDCPAPEVVSAAALAETSVLVTFSRTLDPTSVSGDGSQLTIAGGDGLAVSAATVDGRTVTLTTAPQVGGQSYTVTVATSITDGLGTALSDTANTADFLGYVPPAVLLISEVNANIANGCDLIELRALVGGSLDGYVLKQRTSTLVTFSGLMVAADDIVVVHIDGDDLTNCNTTSSGNETTAVDELPSSAHAQNYDTAWDWYSPVDGLTATDNVFTLYDNGGAIIDAVFASDAVTGTAASATETQAAAVAEAGEWEMIGGGIPGGGFVDDDFNAHAVQDLNATGTDPAGESLQRTAVTDTNTKADWTQAASTWGAAN